jgi:probable rRNA maturation factor
VEDKMLDISNTTKQSFTLSHPLLQKISNEILGPHYEVSLVIVGDKKARTLNQEHRGKDYIPNVLSFPIDDTMGEIFLNQKTALLECTKFNLSASHYLYYLIIHSMLHLKNFDHGDEMTAQENFFMKKFFDIEVDF